MRGTPDVQLRPVRLDDENELLAAERNMVDRDGFTLCPHYLEGEPWSDYVGRIDGLARGIGLTDHLIAETSLLAIVDDQIVGRASVRHELNDRLAFRGGHIGYGVIDIYRRKGYATEMLRQCIGIARDLGIARALLTINEDNLGSQKVAEACGGALVNTDVAPDGTAFRRYEINTSAAR